MVGAQGHTPPPAGHWAEPFWEAARADEAAHAVPPGMVLVQVADANRLCDFVQNPEASKSATRVAALRVRALIDSQAVGNG